MPEGSQLLTALMGRRRLSVDEVQQLVDENIKLGGYAITGCLGRGGMGAVLSARDEGLGRDVALKVLPPNATEVFRARFQREAQALARLDHPNIVRVHAYETADELSFLVLELVSGKSLEARLKKEGTLSEQECWRLIRHTTRAMATAEQQGILHRDLKPGNILWLPGANLYKICDFGLARFQTNEGSELTVEGTTMGTPFYMSPEQVMGKELDARSDMYSLGMTLHEVLTDKIPFEGGPIGGVLVRRLETDVPSLAETCPAASEALIDLVNWLCQRKREARPESWSKLKKHLEVTAPGGADSGVHRLDAQVAQTKAFDEVLSRETPPSDSGGARGPQVRREPSIGEVLGIYKLLRVLGRGGMGVIYEAENQKTQERFAIKALVVGEGPDGERRRKRFETEIEALRRLHHEHIVSVYAHGRKGPYDWYAMDFVEGVELKDVLLEGSLTRYEKLTLFVQVCKAIAHAHERGIVHRDLKPANILIDDEKRAHVLDFGLAKIKNEGQMGLTRTGAFLGTPYYMAPEQFLNPKAAGKLTDVFALGVILFEMMTGQRPFQGETAGEVSYKIMRENAPRATKVNPKLHPSIDGICKKALARDTTQRYASVDAFKKDVIKFRRGTAKTETRTDKIKGWILRWYRENKLPFWVGFVVATLFYTPVVLILYWWLLL